MQVHDVFKYRFADICADPLSQPGYQVKAHKGANRNRRCDAYQQTDSATQVATGTAAKALVYEYLQSATQRQGGCGGK